MIPIVGNDIDDTLHKLNKILHYLKMYMSLNKEPYTDERE